LLAVCWLLIEARHRFSSNDHDGSTLLAAACVSSAARRADGLYLDRRTNPRGSIGGAVTRGVGAVFGMLGVALGAATRGVMAGAGLYGGTSISVH
jgi:hypothetical protein